MLYLLQVSAIVYTIVGLLPFTDYEVRVCLFNVNPENCGGCLLCFSTAEGQGNNYCYYIFIYYLFCLIISTSFHTCFPFYPFFPSPVYQSIVDLYIHSSYLFHHY